MTGYTEKDAARDTGASQRETAAAHHEARDASRVRDGGEGDRPTPQNRRDARRLERRVMDRARQRDAGRDEGDRTER
jgi:hypothetical protein